MRSDLVPQVPTLKEAGTNLSAAGWNTFFAPKAMPAEQVQRYSAAIQKVMKSPEVLQQFKSNFLDPVHSSAAQTQQRLQAYKKHPLHVAASDFVHEVMAERAGFDFEV